MKKSEKPFVIEDLTKRFEDAKSVVVLDYQGLAVKDINGLRNAIREVGGRLIVAKNTLLKLALDKARGTHDTRGTLDTLLQGPTAVVFAEEDEIAPLQKLGKFILEKGLPKLKFGIFGTDIFDAERLLVLSRLPGKSTLREKLVGSLASPMYGLVGTLNANLQKLVYVLSTKTKVTS